jgi:hypothetical protein
LIEVGKSGKMMLRKQMLFLAFLCFSFTQVFAKTCVKVEAEATATLHGKVRASFSKIHFYSHETGNYYEPVVEMRLDVPICADEQFKGKFKAKQDTISIVPFEYAKKWLGHRISVIGTIHQEEEDYYIQAAEITDLNR